MAPAKRMYVAIETFTKRVELGNGEHEDRFIVKDQTRVREGDPVLDGCMEHFRELANPDYPDIEQATAAPGERRGRRAGAEA
jgi:hypothetical protein